MTNLIRKIDMATIKFFVGILLAVGALNHHGVLKEMTRVTFGPNPDAASIITGHVIIGIVSSLMYNVPLTASVIKMLTLNIDFTYWVLLAITAGTGGSILVIGSAAGVAAMGQVKELTFIHYFKKAALPALLGYLGAVAIWMLENYFWLRFKV